MTLNALFSFHALYLYETAKKGLKLDSAHRKYDIEMAKFLSKFLEDYTENDIQIFLELLAKYDAFQKKEYSLKDIYKK